MRPMNGDDMVYYNGIYIQCEFEIQKGNDDGER